MEEKREVSVNEELHNRFSELVGSPEEGKCNSQSKAAQSINYSLSVIPAYKSRTYNGNVKALEEKVEAWLKREARHLSRVDVPVVETSNLARAVGVETKGTMTTVISRIVDELRGRDAVVIIDEADYLSDVCLELLRRVVNDKAQTGVVLIALPRLEYKLRNLRNDHEQLTSRVGVFVKLGKMKKTDAAKILANVWHDLSAEAVEAFTQVAARSVRTLVKLIERIHQTLAANNIDQPDPEAITTAGELLMR